MIQIFASKAELASAAAQYATESLSQLLRDHSTVRLLAATGLSQLEFLQRLGKQSEIDWPRVELFHLDEYVGLSMDHPASFARYVKERIVEPLGIGKYHLLDGMRDPNEMAGEMSAKLIAGPIHLAFAGIGENGHLAFNEPPADFAAREPYIVVDLDEASRRQQVGEGWFTSLDEVPKRAITISIPWLLKAGKIICLASDVRKAEAVKASLEGPVSPMVPASVLRVHPHAHIYLDEQSASLLSRKLPDIAMPEKMPEQS